jgi:hypothetical protein
MERDGKRIVSGIFQLNHIRSRAQDSLRVGKGSTENEGPYSGQSSLVHDKVTSQFTNK